MKRVLIVAGDPSGDLIASHLVDSLKKMRPDLLIAGIGGLHLQRVSDRFLENIVKEHALGFAISPQKLLYFRNVLNNIVIPEIKNNPPDVVIPVDFYGFNSRVAKVAKKMGKSVFYYASPQFWASRPGRADQLRPFVDQFLCLFPFELDFYKKRNLCAQFVGHPILDFIPSVSENRQPRIEAVIGLLPGSRPDEIRRHLPLMAQACDIISSQTSGARFLVFTVPHVSKTYYNEILSQSKPSRCLIELIQDEGFEWRSQLDMAISASGMETLENALLGIPMVIMYKTNWITYFIAKMMINIPYLGMPNLLAGREIVPEFMQMKATPENLAQPLLNWIQNPSLRQQLRGDLLKLRDQFGGNGASDRAARVILEKVA